MHGELGAMLGHAHELVDVGEVEPGIDALAEHVEC